MPRSAFSFLFVLALGACTAAPESATTPTPVLVATPEGPRAPRTYDIGKPGALPNRLDIPLIERGGYLLVPGWVNGQEVGTMLIDTCLLYTSPSPRDQRGSRMPSSA